MRVCIMCGAINAPESMDGPYICPSCDCGIKPNGEKFTVDDAREYSIRIRDWKDMIQKTLLGGDSFDVATMKFYNEKGSIFNARS